MDFTSADESERLLTNCQEATPPEEKNDPDAAATYYDNKFVPIEIILFLSFFGIAGTLPVVQFYVFDEIAQQFGGANITSQNPCSNSSESEVQMTIQKESANLLMYLTFVASFPAVIPTLLIGSYTDKIGRKFALLLSIGCACLRSLVFVIVFTLGLPAGFLYIGFALDGLAGGYGMILMACFGIVADITPPNTKRAFRVTATEFALAASASLAFLANGFWIKLSGYIQPMIFSMSITMLAFICAVIFIPETYTAKRHPLVSEQSLRSLVKKTFQLYSKDTQDRRRWKLCILLCVFFLVMLPSTAKLNVVTLFLLNHPFCWPELQITIFSAARILLGYILNLLLIRVLGTYLKEGYIGIVGCLSGLFLNCLFGIAYSSIFIYVAGVVGLLGDVVTPMVRSLMSRLVKADEQGAMFASVAVVEMLFTAVGGLVGTSLYRGTLGILPGLTFLVFTLFYAVGCILFIIYICKSAKESRPLTETSVD